MKLTPPPVAGIKASDLPVGQIVKLMEGGVETEFIVVNQGLPGSMYDESCNGTWLLRRYVGAQRGINTTDANAYGTSTTNTWLNGDYFTSLGTVEQRVIKQVKIPYRQGGGTGGTLKTGTDGLSVKVFLLSGPELHYAHSTYMDSGEGAAISYFASASTSAAASVRIAYDSTNTARSWWSRSPNISYADGSWYVQKNGSMTDDGSSANYWIRQAVVVPFTAQFDETTYLLKR